MTDTNTGPRPPEGTKAGSIHWLVSAELPDLEPTVMRWVISGGDGFWSKLGQSHYYLPSELWSWKYWCPATPPAPSDAPIPDEAMFHGYAAAEVEWRVLLAEEPPRNTLRSIVRVAIEAARPYLSPSPASFNMPDLARALEDEFDDRSDWLWPEVADFATAYARDHQPSPIPETDEPGEDERKAALLAVKEIVGNDLSDIYCLEVSDAALLAAAKARKDRGTK